MDNASYGIRVNAIMPGLIDTPMAIEGYAQATGIDQDALRTARDKMVPLGRSSPWPGGVLGCDLGVCGLAVGCTAYM